MNLCRTCTNWEKVGKKIAGDDFGICNDFSVQLKITVDGNEQIHEDGTVWTEADFGCIYYRDEPNDLINLSDELFSDDDDDDD